MRLALVCPYAWDRFGGVQSHVRGLAAALRARDHEVSIIAPRSFGSDEHPDDVYLAGRAVGVPANGSIAPIAPGPRCFVETRRALRAIAPDVVHVHEPFVPGTSLYSVLTATAPCVGTFHSAGGSRVFYRLFRRPLRRIAGRLAIRTAVSEAALDVVAAHLPGDYALIPNGVDVRRFAPRAEPEPRGTDVLFVGRIEPRKGLDVLIRALGLIRDLEPALVVAGTGPKEADCRALARALDVEVRWLGAPSDDRLPEVFASAAVYCNPAIGGESFGIVLLEAMASGRPVVCSDLPGFRNAAGDAALLFPAGDERALAGALRSVLTTSSKAETLVALGVSRAALFDWREVAAAMEEVYLRAGTIHA